MHDAHIITPGDGIAPVAIQSGRERQVVGVRLSANGTIVDCESGLAVPLHGIVIIRFPEGLRSGRVLRELRPIEHQDALPRITRRATPEDLAKISADRKKAQEFLFLSRDLVRELNLDMRIGFVELYFDGSRMVIYFSTEERVDFRELLRQMHKYAHRRVELRQVGLRDLAGQSGGVGSCGQELCCSRWLIEFDPVSIRSAKTQCLSITSEKLTGQCGRLKCCLNYENDVYRKLREGLPEPGKWIRVEGGYAKVREIDVFKQSVSGVIIGGDYHNPTSWTRDQILEHYRKPPQDLLDQLNDRSLHRNHDDRDNERGPRPTGGGTAHGERTANSRQNDEKQAAETGAGERPANDRQRNDRGRNANRPRRGRDSGSKPQKTAPASADNAVDTGSAPEADPMSRQAALDGTAQPGRSRRRNRNRRRRNRSNGGSQSGNNPTGGESGGGSGSSTPATGSSDES